MNNDSDDWLCSAEVLRLIPDRLQHSQLYRIESRDPSFPKADIRPGMKPRYPREKIEQWVRTNWPTEGHQVTEPPSAALPKKRQRRGNRS